MKNNQEALMDFFSRFKIGSIPIGTEKFSNEGGMGQRSIYEKVVQFDGDFEREKQILIERLASNGNHFFNDGREGGS